MGDGVDIIKLTKQGLKKTKSVNPKIKIYSFSSNRPFPRILQTLSTRLFFYHRSFNQIHIFVVLDLLQQIFE